MHTVTNTSTHTYSPELGTIWSQQQVHGVARDITPSAVMVCFEQKRLPPSM